MHICEPEIEHYLSRMSLTTTAADLYSHSCAIWACPITPILWRSSGYTHVYTQWQVCGWIYYLWEKCKLIPSFTGTQNGLSRGHRGLLPWRQHRLISWSLTRWTVRDENGSVRPCGVNKETREGTKCISLHQFQFQLYSISTAIYRPRRDRTASSHDYKSVVWSTFLHHRMHLI